MNEKIIQIPVEQLQPNPLQPRGVITPESLTELINSIREHGIIEPLIVADTPAGYQIIAGERRWRSAKILGLNKVPVIFRKTNPRQMLEIALIENVQREDLSPLDRAKAFRQLQQEFNLSISKIAKKVGKSISFISNSIRLLELPDAVKDGLLSGLISEGHARAIAGLGTNQKIIKAYKTILKEKASVRRAEELARLAKNTKTKEAGAEPAPSQVIAEYKQMRGKIQKILSQNGQAKVKISRSRSQTRIIISWDGGVEETQKQLTNLYQKICPQSSSAKNPSQ